MKRRVRVAVWLSTFDAGGTERQMVELIHGLARNHYEVHALCFHARGPWRPRAAAGAASIREFPISGFARRSTWRELRRYARWCRDRQIQIVLTSDYYTNVFGLTGAALAGVPVRLGGRREINTDKNLAKLFLQRASYGLAHRVVANSQAAAARLRAETVPSANVAVVQNGIDAGVYAANRSARGIRRAITVANLRDEKGHDVLIEAIGRLDAAGSTVEFQFAGDGPRRAALERLVQRRGLQERVRFLGERHDLPLLLAEADLFILPSRTEAFPNSLMEAMAAGLPVIACRVGGIPELVSHGRDGVLVPAGDPAALARAISNVLDDPTGAAAMGAAARETVRARFSLQQMVSGFVDLFTTQLQQRRRAVDRPAAVAEL